MTTHVGSIRIDAVIDGGGRFRPQATFPGTSDDDWLAHQDLLDADGMLPFVMGGFLLRDGDRTVLVDAGLGVGHIMGMSGGAMLDSLAAVGLGPGDITDVVFTHLHIDHIGWASADGHTVFSNATYRCDEADWNHFMVEHPGSEAERLEPARQRFETWSGSGPVLPGLDALAAPGHTPGSTVLVASSGTERALMLGDVVHCPVQLVDDEWAAMFDVDPVMAKATRNALAREIESAGTPVAAAHFPGLQFGRLVRAEGRRRWVV
jgi:glyoxylase-like metal-dependent hydrolase (beta-lactamase superfamily II)